MRLAFLGAAVAELELSLPLPDLWLVSTGQLLWEKSGNPDRGSALDEHRP